LVPGRPQVRDLGSIALERLAIAVELVAVELNHARRSSSETAWAAAVGSYAMRERRRAAPRWPFRSTRSSRIGVRVRICSRSARSYMRRRVSSSSVTATSRSVRAREVTGIPWSSSISRAVRGGDAVGRDASPRADAAPAHDQVDGELGAGEVAKRAGTAVREEGARPICEHGSAPSAELAEGPAPNREHPAIEAV
jgi:hypothetical protein